MNNLVSSWNLRSSGNWKATLTKDEQTNKLLNLLSDTSSDNFANDPTNQMRTIYLITSITASKYAIYFQQIDELYKQYLNDFQKAHKTKQSKLATIPILLWLYCFYLFVPGRGAILPKLVGIIGEIASQVKEEWLMELKKNMISFSKSNQMLYPQNHYSQHSRIASTQLVFVLLELILINMNVKKSGIAILGNEYLQNFIQFIKSITNEVELIVSSNYWDEINKLSLIEPEHMLTIGTQVLQHVNKINSKILTAIHQNYFKPHMETMIRGKQGYQVVRVLAGKINQFEKEILGEANIILIIYQYYFYMDSDKIRLICLSHPKMGISNILKSILLRQNPWSIFPKIDDMDNETKKRDFLFIYKKLFLSNDEVLSKISFNSIKGIPLHEITNIDPTQEGNNAAPIENDKLPDCYLIIKKYLAFSRMETFNEIAQLELRMKNARGNSGNHANGNHGSSRQGYNNKQTSNEAMIISQTQVNNQIKEKIKRLFDHVIYFYENSISNLFHHQPEANVNTNSTHIDSENKYFNNMSCFIGFLMDSFTFLFEFLNELNYFPEFLAMMDKLDKYSSLMEHVVKRRLGSSDGDEDNNQSISTNDETVMNIISSHLEPIFQKKNKSQFTRNYFSKIDCLRDNYTEKYLSILVNKTIAKQLLSMYIQVDVESSNIQIIANSIDSFIDTYIPTSPVLIDSSIKPPSNNLRKSRSGSSNVSNKPLAPLLPSGTGERGGIHYTVVDWRVFVALMKKVLHLMNFHGYFFCTPSKLKLLSIYAYSSSSSSSSKSESNKCKERFNTLIKDQYCELLKFDHEYAEENIKYKAIRTMDASMKYYMELSNYLEFDGEEFKERVNSIIMAFDVEFKKIEAIHALFTYLRAQPYCLHIKIPEKIQFDEYTLSDLEQHYSGDLVNTLTEGVGIDESILEDLLFFTTYKSNLFHSISCRLLGIGNSSIEEGDDQDDASTVENIPLHSKIKILEKAIQDTQMVMNEFLSDGISIELLEKHLVLLKNGNIDEEINVICKYMSERSSESPMVIKKKLENNLKAADEIIKIKGFASDLYGFQSFIDRVSIDELLALLNNTANHPIADLIQKIKEKLGGMDFKQFKYFDKLKKSQKILQLKYFKYNKKKFTQEIDIAKNNSIESNNEYGLSILSNLEMAYDLLQPIQDQLQVLDQQPQSADRKKIKLTELCKEIKKVLEKGATDLDKKLDSFEQVLKGQCALLSYFSTNASLEDLDFFCNACEKLIENGIYKSRLSLHPKGEALHFRTRKDEQSPGEKIGNLQDIVRALYVFTSGGTIHSSESSQVKKKANFIKEFVGIYPKAIEIHELQLRLEAAGHPKYRGINTIINGDHQLSIKLFDTILYDLKQEEKLWEESILHSYKHYKRLLFLDRAQLANVVSGLVNYFKHFPFKAGKKGGGMNDEQYTSTIIEIDPYLWSCFPDTDADRLDSKGKEQHTRQLLDPSNKWIIEKKDYLDNNQKNTGKGGEGEISAILLLNFIGELTEKLYEQLMEIYFIDEDNQQNEKPKVMVVESFTDFEIMTHIYEQSELKLPSYSQILFCDKSTLNLTLLKQFLERVDVFAHLYYYIVNVDYLDVELREYLLEWLDNNICMMNNNDHTTSIGRLTLYFTTRSCAERFNSLILCDVNKKDLSPKERFAQIQQMPKENNIQVVEYYTSSNGTGKSYEIHKTLEGTSPSNQIFISLYEDFTPNQFIKLLKSQYQRVNEKRGAGAGRENKDIRIHLDISGYSPLRVVNRFLELLLCNGYIWDERTGNMLKLHNGYEYYFYIELHTVPQEDELFNDQSATMAMVLNYLSILNIIGKEVKEVKLQLDISDNFIHVVEWWKIYKSGILSYPTPRIGDIKEEIRERMGNLTNLIANKEEILKDEKVADAFRKCLEDIQLFLQQRNIHFPKGNRYQNLFLNYMKTRTEFLWRYIGNLYQQIVEYESDINIQLPIMYEIFLLESARLAEENIGNQITINPPLTVFRDYVNNSPSFIYFNSCDPPSRKALVDKYKGFDIQTREDLIGNNSAPLRASLQLVFNIEKLYEIIEKQKYVLTPDFAFKLYFIYERMKARENVMLSGGTGVGKTELLTLYSSIINTDINYTYDIIYSLKQLISVEILAEIQKRNPQLKLPEFHSHTITHIDELIEYLNKITVNSMERFKIISHYLCKDIYHKMQQYPLLEYKSNGYVARVGNIKNQPIEWDEDKVEEEEIVVNTMNKLVILLKEYVKCTFKKIFYTIRMHYGMSAENLRTKILSIIDTAKDIEVIYKQLNEKEGKEEEERESRNIEPSIVVFIDEVNTTSVMGMIKSIFCDKKIDDIRIPDNILWVCAINPYLKAPTNDKMSLEIEKFTGMGMDERVYSVREVPKSLKNLTIDFDTLTKDQEDMFISSLLRLQKVCDNEDQYHSLTKLTLFSQRILQEFSIHKMQVSIRDIMRTVTLYDFFRKNTCLLGHPVIGADPINSIHWQALIMAIGTSYYLRLFNDFRMQFAKRFRTEMNAMKIINKKNECPPQLEKNLEETMRTIMKHLYDNTKIPPGIACTQALLENLWSIVVCCSAMIPIIIIGPPGCSKTLSFSIAIQNMSREISDNEKTFYNQLPRLDTIRYQCSPQSTDTEIKKRYKEALARQRLFDADSIGAKSLGEMNRCVVFLDEAGLTGDKPLKVIHYYMDHPKVCTVILSNELLDAAKMNRGLQVYQNPTSHEDLISLAKGSLGINDEKVIKYLCSAYRQTIEEGNEFTTSSREKGLFQLRDFIYFLRFLRATAVVNGRLQIDGRILLRALQRNFNGITKENFRKLVDLWFNELNKALQNPLQIPNKFKPTIELIRENLDYRISPNENPNTSAFRFLLIIDPTENETTVSLLYSTNLCKVDPEKAKINLLPAAISTQQFVNTIDQYKQKSTYPASYYPTISKVKAIRSYNANQQQNSSNYELSFQFGDEILVRNDNIHMNHWWQGELVRTGKIGIFPYQFTVVTEIEGNQIPEFMKELLFQYPENEDMQSSVHQLDIQSPNPKDVKRQIKKYYNPNKTVQICLGDFAMDKTDDEITDAVRKVMDAMKEGKIVILVNSNLINGSFYDLFNRYFKIVKKHKEEGDDYYANVALGSFSRECKVHKDFKVIIHLPQSKLNQTPLPFLTRFEKYILSTQDVLSDLLESRPWTTIPIVKSTGGKNTFVELLQKGCDEFVEEIHKKDNDGKLLYGLVNTETVSSLVLESAMHGFLDDCDVPKIKLMNYKKLVEENEMINRGKSKSGKSNEELQIDKPSNEFNKNTADGKLRYLIRKANRKLLQLARPELLFTSVRLKDIPHYIYEYFMKQEHFSVFRFLKNLINIHIKQLNKLGDDETRQNEGMEMDLNDEGDAYPYFQTNHPSTSSRNTQDPLQGSKETIEYNKWCIFTRTSGEFEQLSSKNNLKKLLSEKIEKENIQHYDITTIQLELIKSSKILHQKLNELAKQDKCLILFAIDMKKCTTTQINQLRRLIDNMIHSKSLFVLVLHFPTKLFLTEVPWCYNSIYLHSWEYIYIDSLGFTINKLHKSENNINNNKGEMVKEDVDGRSWIAKAFGLKINNLSTEDDNMIEYYKRESIIVCKNYIKKYKPDTTPPPNMKSMKIYSSNFNNKVQDRYEMLEDLFNNENYVLESFIRRFINSWSKELLNQVVNTVCEYLIKGNLHNSFVNTVQNTLDYLLSANVYQLMEVLLKNYQLEHTSLLYHKSYQMGNVNNNQLLIMKKKGALGMAGSPGKTPSSGSIKRNKLHSDWEEIYKKTIHLLKPVEFQLISQIEEKVQNNFTFPPEFHYITKTPMFPFIYLTMEKYVDILFLEFNQHLQSTQDVPLLVQNFIKLIEKNKNLWDLIQTITRIKSKFLDDVLIKKLSLSFPTNCFQCKKSFNILTSNDNKKEKVVLSILRAIMDKIVVDIIESDVLYGIGIANNHDDVGGLGGVPLSSSSSFHEGGKNKALIKDTYIILGYFVCARIHFNKLCYIRDFMEPLNNELFNILGMPIKEVIPIISSNLSSFTNHIPLDQLGNTSLSKCKYLDYYLIKLFLQILCNSLSHIFRSQDAIQQPQGNIAHNIEEIVNKYKQWCQIYAQFNGRTLNILSVLSHLHLNKPDTPSDLQSIETYLKMNCLFLFSRDLNLLSEGNRQHVAKLFSSVLIREYFIENKEIFKNQQQQQHQANNQHYIMNELYYILQSSSLLFNEFDGMIKNRSKDAGKLMKNLCLSVFKGRRLFESTNYTMDVFLANLKVFYQMINGEFINIFPNTQKIWNECVEFDWYLNTCYSFINKRPKLTIDAGNEQGKTAIQFEKQKAAVISSMSYLGNEVLENTYQAGAGAGAEYTYIYSLLMDDHATILNNHQHKITNLEDLFYHFYCKLNDHKEPEKLMIEYRELKGKQGGTIMDTIQLSSIVTNILRKSSKYVKADNIPAELLEILKKNNKGSPMNADIYFLQKNYPESGEILSDMNRLKKFRFGEEWYEPKISKTNVFHKYSFMIEYKSEKGKLYQEMVTIIKNNNNANANAIYQWIQQKVGAGGERYVYILRMYLVLILFYEYFDVLLPAPQSIVQLFANQQMQQVLRITASEMNAYQFLLNGARVLNDDIFKKDVLLRLFSNNIRQSKKEDLTPGYLLVNILACCLGTPSTSNHFYKSIFELRTLNGSKMPGSAYGGREFWDCGFRMSEQGALDPSPTQPIMQNHNRYRLGLNGLIWSPICWYVILNEGTAVADCQSLYHFINYVGDEAYGGKNVLQQYRAYIASRAFGFCNVLSQDPTMVERNINVNLFLVESLNRFSSFIQSNLGRLSGAYRNQFADVEQCVQYETVLMNIFQTTINNYDAVKQEYQNSIVLHSPSDKLIKLQDKQSKIYTKLSFKGVIDDQLVKEKKNHLISCTNQLRSIIEISALIPTFASAYYHITNELSYKLPRDIMNSTVEEVFKYIKEELLTKKKLGASFNESNANIVKENFSKLSDGYLILNKTISDFNNECQTIELPKINEESIFSILISQKGEYDIIIKTIETLFSKLNKIYEVLRKKKYSKTLNEHEIYFPSDNLSKEYDLASIIHQISHPITLPTVDDQLENWIEELMSLNLVFQAVKQCNRNEVTFIDDIRLDFENINRELLIFYNSIKEFVSNAAFKCFQKTFYSSEDVPNHLEQCRNSIKLNSIDNLKLASKQSNKALIGNEVIEEMLKDLNPMKQLQYLINEKMKQFPDYCSELKSPIEITRNNLSKIKEETVNKMAENIVKLIKSLDGEHEINSESKIIDELLRLNVIDTPECGELFNKSMSYLKCVGNKIIEIHHQKWWIYHIYGGSSKVHEPFKKELATIKGKYNLKIMGMEEMGELKSKAKKLLEYLMSDKTAQQAKISTNTKIYKFITQTFQKKDKSSMEFNELLPESVTFLRYAQYMFWFHEFCGEIEYYYFKMKQHALMKQTHENSSLANQYNVIEWVPEEFKLLENKNKILSETLLDKTMMEEDDEYDFGIEILNKIEANEAVIQMDEDFEMIAYGEKGNSNERGIGKAGLRGIKNPGDNICWLTSILQCIASSKGAADDLDRLMRSMSENPECKSLISYYVVDVMQQLHDENLHRSVIDASTLLQKLGQHDFKYSFRAQQDPSEFYNSFISHTIPNELNKCHLPSFTERFNMAIESRIECRNYPDHFDILQHESQNTLFLLDISEEIHSFHNALELYFQSSLPTKCTKHECNSSTSTSSLLMKKIRLNLVDERDVNSKSMVFQLKRSQVNHKVSSPMTIPLDPFDFTNYSLLPEHYSLHGTLYAAIIHEGEQTFFGHYYALIKVDGQWYEFNDSHVSPCFDAQHRISSSAFMLFFSLESSYSSPPPPSPSPSPSPSSSFLPSSIPNNPPSSLPYPSPSSHPSSAGVPFTSVYQQPPPMYSPSMVHASPPSNIPVAAAAPSGNENEKYFPYFNIIQNIWREVLPGNPSVGLDDDFFQVGGNQNLIFSLFGRLYSVLDNLQSPNILYQYITPRTFIEYLLSNNDGIRFKNVPSTPPISLPSNPLSQSSLGLHQSASQPLPYNPTTGYSYTPSPSPSPSPSLLPPSSYQPSPFPASLTQSYVAQAPTYQAGPAWGQQGASMYPSQSFMNTLPTQNLQQQAQHSPISPAEDKFMENTYQPPHQQVQQQVQEQPPKQQESNLNTTESGNGRETNQHSYQGNYTSQGSFYQGTSQHSNQYPSPLTQSAYQPSQQPYYLPPGSYGYNPPAYSQLGSSQYPGGAQFPPNPAHFNQLTQSQMFPSQAAWAVPAGHLHNSTYSNPTANPGGYWIPQQQQSAYPQAFQPPGPSNFNPYPAPFPPYHPPGGDKKN